MTSTSEPGSVQTSRAFVVIVGMLAIGTLLNVAFGVELPPTASGIRGHPDNALSTLVNIEQPVIRTRHGFEAYLHDVARGGTITVPHRRAVYHLALENFSQVTIVVADYDHEVSEETLLGLGAVTRIEGVGRVNADHDVVSYTFLMADDLPATSVTYYTVDGVVYVVDDRLGSP